MTIHHAIWTVEQEPVLLNRAVLPSEKVLEDMIVAAPTILSDSWMLIGRQTKTAHGGILDLLAIAPDGSLVLIELKRDKTPRDVIAQALDYASWVETLEPEDVVGIYGHYAPGRDLKVDFHARFGTDLTDETLNQAHELVIAAGELDDDSERIVGYLADRGIAINVLCFQVFTQGAQQLLSRAWLRDRLAEPSSELPSGSQGQKEPWNGEFYASFGTGPTRSWDDAVQYGFICAGGGSFYSKTLGLLKLGDRIWVKSPNHGFVGVGRVTGVAEPALSFKVRNDAGQEVPARDLLKRANYHWDVAEDPKCEWFVAVDWAVTVTLDRAVSEIGLFGNQNTVCRPTTPKWRTTVERLKVHFPQFDKAA